MAKTTLEKTVQEAANSFALQIIEAVKNATLQELIAMQDGTSPKKGGRLKKAEPATQAIRKPGRPKKTPTAKKATDKPGRRTKATKKIGTTKKAAKKIVTRNYPKCSYPGCNKNRFARGKGFCGEHWKKSLAGEIKPAEAYKK